MIFSVHIADLGRPSALRLLRSPPEPDTPGLSWASTFIAAPLRTRPWAGVHLRRVCLVAAWQDDHALDDFLEHHRAAHALAGGWRARFDPVRAWGSWSELPGLPADSGQAIHGPVAVLTLGRLRLLRTRPFLSASLRAERDALAQPAMVAGTALARPPRLVATFTIWSQLPQMRSYATGQEPGGHRRAMDAHRARPFHHESVFIRLSPYATAGLWDGHNPLRLASRA